MGNKRGFDYDSEAEQPWASRVDRPSLAEKALGPKRAMALAKRLVTLAPAEWEHLGLEPRVVTGLTAFVAIPPKARGAIKRQLGHIARQLRDTDHEAIEFAMGAGRGNRTEREEQIEALVRWRTRLVEDFNTALPEFLGLHPNANRQRIRQLSQRCVKVAGTPAASKAGRALLDALKEAAGHE